MPRTIKAVTTNLYRASLYQSVFVVTKKAGNVISRTTADVETFLPKLIYFVLFAFSFSGQCTMLGDFFKLFDRHV